MLELSRKSDYALRAVIYLARLSPEQFGRVSEIANRVAMSESDLYRKQRIAITEVARTLADMEATMDVDGAIKVEEDLSGEGIRLSTS